MAIVNDESLNRRLIKNLPFHIILNEEIRVTPFGQITVNVELKNGTAILKTLNIVKTRRRKYAASSDKE